MNDFEEFKENVKKKMKPNWLCLEEDENQLLISSKDGVFFNHYFYEKELTEKMKEEIPFDVQLVYRLEIYKKDKTKIFEFYRLIYDYKKEIIKTQVTVNLLETDPFVAKTTKLDKEWGEEKCGDFYTLGIEKAFKDEIKNLNRYRLHFLFR